MSASLLAHGVGFGALLLLGTTKPAVVAPLEQPSIAMLFEPAASPEPVAAPNPPNPVPPAFTEPKQSPPPEPATEAPAEPPQAAEPPQPVQPAQPADEPPPPAEAAEPAAVPPPLPPLPEPEKPVSRPAAPQPPHRVPAARLPRAAGTPADARPTQPDAAGPRSSAAPAAPQAAPPVLPARPVAGMATNQRPEYPETARRRGEQGRVVLRVVVSADGVPLEVSVASGSGHPSLDASAVAAVRRWRFIPATQAGTPLASTAEVPIQFRLED